MNSINTWRQSKFVDQKQYSGWTEEEKEKADLDERKCVVPELLQNKICMCNNESNARWIAKRLNLASDLEELVYNYATGKSDGQDIIEYVSAAIDRM